MFHLILTACLAGDSSICRPILLPEGSAPDEAGCVAAASRISTDWLARHPGLAAAGTACAAAEDASVAALPMTEIAPGVFTHIGAIAEVSPENRGRIANLSFVVGETVAVIDAGSSRAEGEALFAAIRRVTDRPISHLILTHMHPDHVLGAEVLAEAGARVVGHPQLAAALDARAGTYLENFTRLLGAGEMIGTTVPTPDETAEGGMTIDLGTTRLSLSPAPTAHTDNDLVVRDEGSGTLFTGDLIFRELAPVVDGSLNGWLQWMALPPAPPPARIVPGHGPVAATWEEASAAQQALLAALRDATRARIAEGMPMSEAVPAILQDLQPLAPGWTNFEPTVSRDATAAYKELEWE